MGTPTTPGGPVGADCLACMAAGTAPTFINVQITGIESCPCARHTMPVGFYTLKQTVPHPCTWEFKDLEHEMNLTYEAGFSRFWIRDVDDAAVRYFWKDSLTICEENFTNGYTACIPPFQCGFDGNVIVV